MREGKNEGGGCRRKRWKEEKWKGDLSSGRTAGRGEAQRDKPAKKLNVEQVWVVMGDHG